MPIKAAISKLQAYQGADKLTLHPGADEDLLTAVESTYGVTLPDDFKALYRFSDGFETDEDIFNMIPLAEIRSNREGEKDSPLYIAEYMIYSDMWRLEINPDNCNDYKIMVEYNGNQLVLTNSLAEFVDRFLKGGVFDSGGLYEWQVEIEALPIYSTKLKTARFLLTVFYYGLRYNLITEKEVIGWADRLIIHENEPDFFFIDLSLGHDKNRLIDLLYPIAVPDSSLVARALLGLLHHRLAAGAITVSDAVVIIDEHNFRELLTQTEAQGLNYITDGIWMDEAVNGNIELSEKVLDCLTVYQDFKIVNYKDWIGFSSCIEYRYLEKEKDAVTPILKRQPKRSYFDTDLFPNAIIYSLALVSFIILITTYPLVKNGMPISNYRSDLFKISKNYFTVFACFYLLKGSLWLVRRWRL